MDGSKSRLALNLGILTCLFLASCGDGGGDGGGSGGLPATAQTTTVSGIVQAPGGQIALNSPSGFLQQVARFISPTAYASVSGLTPVPDGTPVQIIRLNSMGTSFSVLSTTVTAGGRYSFNLTNLGLEPSNDLLVRVASGAVQMRAFLTGSNVDMDPGSEAAVQIVLEQIMSTPGASIHRYTVQELSDIAGSINTFVTAKQLAAGLTIVSTITSIRNAVIGEPGLMAFLNATVGDGQTSEGPGDIGNYFPYVQGNVSTYRGTISISDKPMVDFENSDSITGTKVIGALTTLIFLESNHNNRQTPIEEYVAKDTQAITVHGNNDSSDFITPQLVPIRAVRFPLAVGITVSVVDRKGLNSGIDLDEDGRPEMVDLRAEYTVLAFEEVSVPAGSFPNSVKVETRQTQTYFSSAFGISATIESTQTLWRAPGIGFVKKIELIRSQGFADDFSGTIREELVDFSNIRQISLTTNNIIYDPVTKRIYASIPGNPGSIRSIDPETGNVGPPITVGNEPTNLALTDNGQYLYVGLDGEGAVQRVDLATQTAGPKFSLGSDTFSGPYYVNDLEVLPGTSTAVVVSRKYKGITPSHAGVAIFDNGIQRPNTVRGHQAGNVIEFGGLASTLYGFDNEISSHGFMRMSVDASGVSLVDTTDNLLGGSGVDIKYADGLVYSSAGQVINPTTLSRIADMRIPAGVGPVVDSTKAEVIYLSQPMFSTFIEVRRFNQLTFQPLRTTQVKGVAGGVTNLIRWATDGLAFRTSVGQLFLIQSSR